jgi:hypothetical protein
MLCMVSTTRARLGPAAWKLSLRARGRDGASVPACVLLAFLHAVPGACQEVGGERAPVEHGHRGQLPLVDVQDVGVAAGRAQVLQARPAPLAWSGGHSSELMSERCATRALAGAHTPPEPQARSVRGRAQAATPASARSAARPQARLSARGARLEKYR